MRAAECIREMAIDAILQMNLLKAGVLWHLIGFLFQYDFTLDSSGVEKDEATHQQVSPLI